MFSQYSNKFTKQPCNKHTGMPQWYIAHDDINHAICVEIKKLLAIKINETNISHYPNTSCVIAKLSSLQQRTKRTKSFLQKKTFCYICCYSLYQIWLVLQPFCFYYPCYFINILVLFLWWDFCCPPVYDWLSYNARLYSLKVLLFIIAGQINPFSRRSNILFYNVKQLEVMSHLCTEMLEHRFIVPGCIYNLSLECINRR